MAQALVPTGASAVDPATASVQRGAPKPELLKPNLVVLKASDLHIDRTPTGRYLRFASSLGNIGRGPIEVRPNPNQPCPAGQHHASQVIYRDVDGSRFFHRRIDTQTARRSAGCMIFHPRHDHWHFKAASLYRLFQPGPEQMDVRVVQRKMSFCLRDSRRIPNEYGTFKQNDFYGECSQNSPQGISNGWIDVYQSYLAGQALRLPLSVRDGRYCLEITVDPQNQLLEGNDEDNTSMRAFTLVGNRITYQRSERCEIPVEE